ncbi:hypothetical protein FOXYSP1_08012 [Fusarium oxysporum f. sp. phaseoli]
MELLFLMNRKLFGSFTLVAVCMTRSMTIQEVSSANTSRYLPGVIWGTVDTTKPSGRLKGNARKEAKK